MIFWDIVLRKKVSIVIAIIVLLVVFLIAAWAISAKAGGGVDVGLKILSRPTKCALDPGTPPPGTCFNNCPVCGSLKGVCASLYEVRAQKISGSRANPLYQSEALCLYNPQPPNGGTFRSSGFCVGKVIGKGPHMLSNFGCTR